MAIFNSYVNLPKGNFPSQLYSIMVSGGTGDPWPGCRPHGRPRTRPHHASPAEGQEPERGCVWPPPGDDQDLGLVHTPSNVGETVLLMWMKQCYHP